jgi:hypothetical protein
MRFSLVAFFMSEDPMALHPEEGSMPHDKGPARERVAPGQQEPIYGQRVGLVVHAFVAIRAFDRVC